MTQPEKLEKYLTVKMPRRANAFQLVSGMFHDPLQDNRLPVQVPESSLAGFSAPSQSPLMIAIGKYEAQTSTT